MLSYFKYISARRHAWGLLALSALFFETCALFFQHVLGLSPCVMCIYERLAMLDIFFAGLIGMTAPQCGYVRWAALAIWGGSALNGLQVAIQHVDYQLNPSPFNVCSPYADFPEWAPLDQWVPWLFFPDGDCSEISWQFLTLSMPQWLVGIFGFYALVCFMVALADLARPCWIADIQKKS